MKKETLEEAAERISKEKAIYESAQDDTYHGFILGAKWQAERMKEEILKYNIWFHTHCMYYDGWNIKIPLGDKYPEVYTEEEIYEIYLKENGNNI